MRRALLLPFALFAACNELTVPEHVAEQHPAEVSPIDPPPAGSIPAGGAGWRMVSAGRDRTCALDVTGRAWCWGAEGLAPLATGGATDVCWSIACVPSPAPVKTTLRFVTISVGEMHVCAIDTGGRLWCWGDNARGQLGVASPRLAGEPVPVNAAGTFVDVAAGADHSCAVRTDGVLFCWGGNDLGQLGRGNVRSDDLPAPVSGAGRYARVAAGQERTCAIAQAGDAWCWGGVWLYSQSGVEYSRRQTVPDRVPSSPNLSSIAVGTLTTCGTETTGAAWCWEANGFGQLGTESLEGSTTPRRVVASVGFTAVAVGLVQACGIDDARRAWCWGNNTFGQLGAPTVRSACSSSDLWCSRTPVPVTGSLRFVQISSGFGSHVCGVTTLTNLYCWGLGNGGQLGLGDPGIQLRQAPALVPRGSSSSSPASLMETQGT